MKSLLRAGGAIVLAAGALPTQAAQTILTFDRGEAACTTVDGGPAGTPCTTDGQFIGADYGSSAGLAVSYDASENTGSRTSLQHTTDRFFQGSDGQAYSFPAGGAGELSKIILTPRAGFEVSFTRFTWDKLTATTSSDFIFELRDASNTLLFSGDNSRPTWEWNSAYTSGPLIFLFGNGGRGVVAVDDVTFDVRGISAAAVPEPSTWAMLILGFGAVGGALRRRRPLAFA
jgi:hypothetical protein